MKDYRKYFYMAELLALVDLSLVSGPYDLVVLVGTAIVTLCTITEEKSTLLGNYDWSP